MKAMIIITFLMINAESSSAIFSDIGWEKQITESNYIISGKVVSIRTENYDYELKAYQLINGVKEPFVINRTSPHTFYEIEILKGNLKESHLTVIEYGGCVDSICEKSSASFKLDINEKSLMFLNRGQDGFYHAPNGSYDMFSITENNELKRKTGSIVKQPFQNIGVNNKSGEITIKNIDNLRGLVRELDND